MIIIINTIIFMITTNPFFRDWAGENFRSMGVEFQTTGAWKLKDLHPGILSLHCGTLRNLPLLDLGDQDG